MPDMDDFEVFALAVAQAAEERGGCEGEASAKNWREIASNYRVKMDAARAEFQKAMMTYGK